MGAGTVNWKRGDRVEYTSRIGGICMQGVFLTHYVRAVVNPMPPGEDMLEWGKQGDWAYITCDCDDEIHPRPIQVSRLHSPTGPEKP